MLSTRKSWLSKPRSIHREGSENGNAIVGGGNHRAPGRDSGGQATRRNGCDIGVARRPGHAARHITSASIGIGTVSSELLGSSYANGSSDGAEREGAEGRR